MYSVDEVPYQEGFMDILGDENLYSQVQIYKSEYYKTLDLVKKLKGKIYILEEELKKTRHCSAHIDSISNLNKKIGTYEAVIIPKLKDQIRKYR